jgi:hypothetical protein
VAIKEKYINMEPNSEKETKFQALPTTEGFEHLEAAAGDNSLTFQDPSIPPTMTHNELKPPAYIWENIKSILDEQDRVKAITQNANSFSSANVRQTSDRVVLLYAAIIMVVGVFMLQVI